MKKSASLILFLLVLLLAGCFPYKEYYAHFPKSESFSSVSLKLYNDTFFFSLLSYDPQALSYDFGTYTRKKDSLFFHSNRTTTDTTMSRKLKQRMHRNYSDQPDSSLIVIANASQEKMTGFSIVRGEQLLSATDFILPGEVLSVRVPFQPGMKIRIKANNIEWEYEPAQLMSFEYRCEMVAIKGPMLKYGVIDGKTITLNGIELLGDRVFRLKKQKKW